MKRNRGHLSPNLFVECFSGDTDNQDEGGPDLGWSCTSFASYPSSQLHDAKFSVADACII